MHGRSAFEGIRRICGAYSKFSLVVLFLLFGLWYADGLEIVNRDDWISRWRNTNFDRKKVLDSVIG